MARNQGFHLGASMVWLVAGFCAWSSVDLVCAEETFDERRARIERMDAGAREELRQHLDQFNALPRDEQERLRQLHRQIEQDPRRKELEAVMRRYCEWAKTLHVSQQAALRELPPAERIERIKSLRHRGGGRWPGPMGMGWLARSERFRDLSRMVRSEDRKALTDWIDRQLAKDPPEIIAPLPEPLKQRLRQELAEAKDEGDRRKAFARAWLSWLRENPKELPPLDARALEELQAKELESMLSSETRQRLQEADSDERQRALIGMLVRVLVYYALPSRRELPLPISHKELAEFLKNEVSAADRKLLANQPEETRPWLWRLYVDSKLPEIPDGFLGAPFGGRRPSGPFGPGGGGPRRDARGPGPGPPPPSPPGEKPPPGPPRPPNPER